MAESQLGSNGTKETSIFDLLQFGAAFERESALKVREERRIVVRRNIELIGRTELIQSPSTAESGGF
jgi:hypothetical protein